MVATSLLIASLSFGAVTAVPILMQPMAIDLGWQRSTLGLAHALAMIAAGIGGLALGYLADRRSFSILALFGGASIGVGLWATSIASAPLELYLAYALLVGAFGQGAFFGPITANVSRWFDRNRTLAMSIVLCGQSIGGLTIPIALRTLAEDWGWRDAMALYGAVCSVVIVTCSAVFLRRPPISGDPRPSSESALYGVTARHWRRFVGVTLTLVLLNSGSFILIAHVAAFAEEQGTGPMLSATVLATLLGSTLVFRLLGGFLVDRNGVGLVLSACTLMLPIGGVVLGIAAGTLWLMLIGAVIFGLGYGGAIPALTGIIRSSFPGHVAGTWISAMFLFGFLAAASGSWLGGYLRDLSGDYSVSIGFSVGLTGASFLLGLIVVRETLRFVGRGEKSLVPT